MGNIPKPERAPVFYGERIIGDATLGTDDDVIIIRLTELSPLIRELMKAELAAFEITHIPAARN